MDKERSNVLTDLLTGDDGAVERAKLPTDEWIKLLQVYRTSRGKVESDGLALKRLSELEAAGSLLSPGYEDLALS